MKANKTQGNSNFTPNIELISEGVHTATLFSIIDLGTQESEFKGEKKQQRKCRFMFEIPSIMSDFGKGPQPVSIATQLTLSMHEKGKLRPMIDKIMGTKLSHKEADDFDLQSILGRNVQIIVEHQGDYCNIQSFLTYNGRVIIPINEPYMLDLDNFSQKIFDKLGDKTKEKITSTPERKVICEKMETF